jgi:hypothetical protein
MTPKDGLLHYRDEPECVVEYTEQYLANTDVYNQFKKFMDIQIVPNSMTTMNELQSAVRQFLKATKDSTTPESDLVLKFEQEFGDYRMSDIQLGSFRYTSVLKKAMPLRLQNEHLLLNETDEPPAKRARLMPSANKHSTAVYYENVMIKNLRKMTFSEN